MGPCCKDKKKRVRKHLKNQHQRDEKKYDNELNESFSSSNFSLKTKSTGNYVMIIIKRYMQIIFNKHWMDI